MRYLTAGESHGEALIGIIEGLPSGLKINIDLINDMLFARQNVYGRGERSKLMLDKAKIMSGLYNGVTTGAPIAVMLSNGNCGNKGEFDFYRPGHVDFAADIKYGYGDAALGAERASARETAIRTAFGAIAMQILSELGINITAYVTQIAKVKADTLTKLDSSVMCDIQYADKIKNTIDEAAKRGDTLGGKLKVIINGVIPGIGSHVFFDRRLDYRLGGALMSIPAVKAVECGMGSEFACKNGKSVADEFIAGHKQERKSNNCGGIEGGISNGMDIVFLLTVKPVPSIEGLNTVDKFGVACKTGKVRGDVCIAPAACIVAEAVAALELSAAILDCLGGDTMEEIKQRYILKGAKYAKDTY